MFRKISRIPKTLGEIMLFDKIFLEGYIKNKKRRYAKMCVDKEFCFKTIDRAIRVYPDPADFIGQAEDFEKFNDPNFQEFAEKHGILPKTRIKVWKRIFDTFGIAKEEE